MTANPEVFGVYKDDLQVNGFSIVYMIEQAMAAFNTGDLETFGKKMGQIMKLAHLPAANAVEKFELKASKPATDMTNLAEILQGFFNGVGVEVGDFMGLLVCIYEADQSALELYADIQIWAEAWQDKSLMETVFAVVFLVAFGQAVKSQVIPACENALGKYDWTPLDKVVSVVEDPFNHLDVVGGDVVINGTPITPALEAAYESYKAENFYGFGETVGAALSSAANDQVEYIF